MSWERDNEEQWRERDNEEQWRIEDGLKEDYHFENARCSELLPRRHTFDVEALQRAYALAVANARAELEKARRNRYFGDEPECDGVTHINPVRTHHTHGNPFDDRWQDARTGALPF